MAVYENRKALRAPDEYAPEVRRARAKLAGGDARGALKVIEEYLLGHPDDALALFEKSRILYELGDRPSSLEARLKALALKKASTDAAAIADMLVEDGLFVEAEALLRARLDSDDGQFTTRFTLAKLLLFSNRFIEAAAQIERLYKGSKHSPLVRADYLEALRFALLGDSAGVGRILDRLRGNNVPAARLTFFTALHEFICGGDPDLFAASMARLRHASRSNAVYSNLFKMVTPDLFLGAENKLRQEFHKVLGDRLRGPRLSGASFEKEELTIVKDIFSRYLAVKFSPIDEGSAGFSGDKVWRAHTELKGYTENSCLMKIGPKYRIAIEKEKMESFVFGKLHPNFHPQILGYSHGRHVAALRLSWASIDDDVPFSLRRLYTDRARPAKELERALEKIMTQALAGWYQRNARPRTVRIFNHLDAHASTLAQYIKSWKPDIDLKNDRLPLPSLGLEINNPVLMIKKLAVDRAAEKMEIPYGLHHGDLNSRNVLLDRAGNVCLIDFYKSGPGFVLLDPARMEVDLRYEALENGEEYLSEIRWMDSRLARARKFRDITEIDVRRSMNKRLEAAYRLRVLSGQVFGLDEDRTLTLYAIAMLIALVRLLKYGHLPPATTELVLAEIADVAETLSGGQQ